MSDLMLTMTAISFLLVWYSLILVIAYVLKPHETLRIVWCPETSSFSFVEVEIDSSAAEHAVAVKHCLFWPEFRACSRRCVG